MSSCTCLSTSINTSKIVSPNLSGVASKGSTLVAVGQSGCISTTSSSSLLTTSNNSSYKWTTLTEQDFSVRSLVHSATDEVIIPSDIITSDIVLDAVAFSYTADSSGNYDIFVSSYGGSVDPVYFNVLVNDSVVKPKTSINPPGTAQEYYFSDINLLNNDVVKILSWSEPTDTNNDFSSNPGTFYNFRVYRENDQTVNFFNGFHPIGIDLTDIIYNTNRSEYVIVGKDGTTLLSTDTSIWHLHQAGDKDLKAINYYNGVYVACGEEGALHYSSDSIYWKSYVIETTDSLNGITNGISSDVYIVGQNGVFLSSSDSGITWNIRSDTLPRGITYNDIEFIPELDKYLIVGESGSIYSGYMKETDFSFVWKKVPHTHDVSLKSIAYGDRGASVVGNRSIIILDATDLTIERGFYNNHKPINRVVDIIDTGIGISSMNKVIEVNGNFHAVGNKAMAKSLPVNAIPLTSTDGWYHSVSAEITGTIISDFLSNASEFVDDLKEQFDSNTQELAEKIKSAQDFLDKASCFGFLEGNPTYDQLLSELGSLQSALDQVLALRKSGIDALGDLSDLLSGSINIQLPDLSSKLGGLLGFIEDANSALSKAKTLTEAAQGVLNTAKNSVACLDLGEAADDVADDILSKAQEQLDTVTNKIDSIQDKLDFANDFINGDLCIDINC